MRIRPKYFVVLVFFTLFPLIGLPSSSYAEEKKPWLDTFNPTRELYVSPTGVNPLITVDVSNKGNDGQLAGSPLNTQGNIPLASDQPSNAIYFDGQDDFISLQTGVGTWGTSYTIEGWLKTTSSASHPSTNFPIIGTWGSVSSRGVGQAFGVNGGHLSFTVSETAEAGCQDDWVNIQGPSINDGNWHHVAATINQSTNTVSLFVDGKIQSQGSIENIADAGCGISALSYIGSTGSWPNIYLNATLDEVRVFGRVLTETEISSHYSAGVDVNENLDSSILGGWNFSQSTGGTIDSPLTLDAAISTAKPGDLFWLQGGEYEGPFTFHLDGTKENPIVFRAYPGKSAKILGYLRQNGAYNWFWGLEITDPDELASADGTSAGIMANAPGIHVINCYIHHNLNRNGIGAWSKGPDHVYYGNIIHDAGKGNIPSNGKNWHGIYAQNSMESDGRKYFVNNVLFENDAGRISFNFHGYATCKDCPPLLSGFYLTQNVFAKRRFLIGGYNVPSQQNIVVSNYFYQAPAQFGYARPTQVEFSNNYLGRTGLYLQWFWGTGETIYNQSLPNVFTDNEIILPPGPHSIFRTSAYTDSGRCEGCPAIQGNDEFDRNTYTSPFKATFFANNLNLGTLNFSQWKQHSEEAGNGFDGRSREISAPKQAKIVLLPNDYEPGRAYLVIYNWGLQDSVSVDLSKFLTLGKDYEVFSIKSPRSHSIQAGIYENPISIPTDKKEFLAFLIKTTGNNSLVPPSNLRILPNQ